MAWRRRGSGDRGQAAPLVLAVVVVAAVAVVALGRLATGAVDAARARTAADAAALAGAGDGERAAAAAATANHGVLRRFMTSGDDVVVDVQVGGATARARATMVLARSPPSAMVRALGGAWPLRSPCACREPFRAGAGRQRAGPGHADDQRRPHASARHRW